MGVDSVILSTDPSSSIHFDAMEVEVDLAGLEACQSVTSGKLTGCIDVRATLPWTMRPILAIAQQATRSATDVKALMV